LKWLLFETRRKTWIHTKLVHMRLEKKIDSLTKTGLFEKAWLSERNHVKLSFTKQESLLDIHIWIAKAYPDCCSALIKSWNYNHTVIWQSYNSINLKTVQGSQLGLNVLWFPTEKVRTGRFEDLFSSTVQRFVCRQTSAKVAYRDKACFKCNK